MGEEKEELGDTPNPRQEMLSCTSYWAGRRRNLTLSLGSRLL